MTQQQPVCQLKVTLKGIRPPIWRRILVRADTHLSELHTIIQAAMGWENYHMYAFTVNHHAYGRPDPELGMSDDSRVKLADIIHDGVTRFSYEYDFGDGWEHEVLIEKTLPAKPNMSYPSVIKGKRACPPEDCGGVWGYAELLEILDNPSHPEHESMTAWVGGKIDPDAFDPAEANDRLNHGHQR
jgi:hypothetical protein